MTAARNPEVTINARRKVCGVPLNSREILMALSYSSTMCSDDMGLVVETVCLVVQNYSISANSDW